MQPLPPTVLPFCFPPTFCEQKLYKTLVFQCAPLLAGIKISNLLIIENQLCPAYETASAAFSREIESLRFYGDDARATYFLYGREELESHLKTRRVYDVLRYLGYPASSLEDSLQLLRIRFIACRMGEAPFPHEFGIFLGYPLPDVAAFIKNGGRNSLYTGYWKVYQDVEAAKATFRKYDEARRFLLKQCF